jgi:hypothetical protein
MDFIRFAIEAIEMGSCPPPPVKMKFGKSINIIQEKIGGNNFKKKTYAI